MQDNRDFAEVWRQANHERSAMVTSFFSELWSTFRMNRAIKLKAKDHDEPLGAAHNTFAKAA